METIQRHNDTPDSPPDDASASRYRDLLREVDAMFDDELEQATINAKTECDKAQARLFVLTNELDRRGVTETSYALPTSAWLSDSCRMTAREASGTVKTARSLAQMPAVAQKAVTGQIVTSGVKLLARTRDRHPDEFEGDESIFRDIATQLDPRDLRVAVSRWEQDVDFEEALADTEHDAHTREFFFNQSYRGRWDMYGNFGVADGNVINTALQGFIENAYIDRTDNRSIYERLADAEVAIHQFWLDHNGTVETSGGNKPHITVTVPYEVLAETSRQLPELDGYAIDPEILRQWACDAGIVRIITDGDNQPIDVGRRTRTIPPALRRALDLRDRGCVWRGCTAPTAWCDAHHITRRRRYTNLDNTELLCRRHHTVTHKQQGTGPHYRGVKSEKPSPATDAEP